MSKESKNVTTATSYDPMIQPYLKQGLDEAVRLYGQQPNYYPEATYVGASDPTKAALLAQKNRAIQGNPLNPAAQGQQLKTISGDYLAGNPFFTGAFKRAGEEASNVYNSSVNSALSNASLAGRYGSGAMNTALSGAGQTFANALTNKAGELAYSNYDTERGRMELAAANAPTLAASDYNDISKLMAAGQGYEGYDKLALEDAMNRFNFKENAPNVALDRYMSYLTTAPKSSTSTSPVYSNDGAKYAAIASAVAGLLDL